MTNELQQTRYDKLVRRVGGIIGPGSKVNEALSELFPMLNVEDDRGELQLLSETRIAFGGDRFSSSGGERPVIQLFNPADSNILITVTRVLVSVNTATQVHFSLQPDPLSVGVNLQRTRDSRLPISTNGPITGQIRHEGDESTPDLIGIIVVGQNDQKDLWDQNNLAVLAPGVGLTFGAIATNSIMNCTFFWRERTAEESELNL